MGPVKRFRDWLNRKIDATQLWPLYLEKYVDRDDAEKAFYFHMVHDPSWTDHYTDEELRQIVKEL